MFKKAKEALNRWCSSKAPLQLFFWAVGIGLAGAVVTSVSAITVLSYTGTEAFCSTTCHEMGTVVKEYRESIHSSNRTGVRATCADCHVPKDLIPLYVRKMGALNDLWGHFVTGSIDTPEKFEAKRHQLATRVWVYMQETDSRECRNCHTADKMSKEKQSEKAWDRHAKAVREKLTCIDCHYGISHTEPEGPGPQELRAAAKKP